ncbi:AAA family ATPase [Mesoplasma whartonense]|uniref:AAA family ATPase n=1 Tax=Mesoplasma whartonense TaxID=2878854 RepID=UPI0020229D48|nr:MULTISPECIES: AAA family ATPase [unclassified Mesoplasma]MCL8212871.1 hypothetical protein [Mesoplasma sp. JKS002661]MCL8216070.1 hypothetical protein [Mesoplasma sp. JKS002657]
MGVNKNNISLKNFANSFFWSMFNLKYQSDDYMIDSIRFTNFANYKDEQVFSFSTEKKYRTDNNEVKQWNSKNIKKYKKTLGIWGKNASGKTTFLELINFVNEYFNYSLKITNSQRINMFNLAKTEFFASNGVGDNYLDPKKNYFSSSAFQLVGDDKIPAFIEFKFDTKRGDLFYRLDISSTSKSVERKNNQHKIISPAVFYEVKESFWLEKNDEKKTFWNNYDFGVWTITDFLLQNLRVNRVNNSENNLASQDQDMTNAIFLLFNFFNCLAFSFDYSITSSTDVESIKYFISESVSVFYSDEFRKPFGEMTSPEWLKIKEKLEKLLLIYINALDQSIKRIQLGLSKVSGSGQLMVNVDFVEKEDGKVVSFDCLSSGTLIFVALSLRLKIMLMSSDRQLPFFFFFDELGNNWHSNLTATFISLFEQGVFGDNIYLIFTSHDPLVADDLDNDSIYYITSDRTLGRLSDIDNLRNDKKFSTDYLNQTVNKLGTNASFNDFDDYMDSFED